jgi:hypothetical protein
MLAKKYLLPCFLFIVIIGCQSGNDERELKTFLNDWSKSLEAKEQSVRGFYDAQFVFPSVVFDAPQDLHYNFDIEHAEIVSMEEGGEFKVTVPFQVAALNGSNAVQGNVVLTIIKSEKGFMIHDMAEELAVAIKQQSMRLQMASNPTEVSLRYDSLLAGMRASAIALSEHYDSVAFFSEVNDRILFYVVNGNWVYPYQWEKQVDGGDYKMGVVTAANEVVIPVQFTKIYNPDGSFDGMIEVEDNGLRGLFHVTGGVFIPAEFDAIYPATVDGVFAQVKKGDNFGWVDNSGKVSFDPSSHPNKKLFQSPVASGAILDWTFTYPGSIKLLINPYDDMAEGNGVIVFPSFVRDLGITPIANAGVSIEASEYGLGMTDTQIKFEKVESIADQFFGLISFFMEAGADARGYHSSQNDLLVMDKNLQNISRFEKLTSDYESQDPCGDNPPSYKIIEPGLYESHDGHGGYKYCKVTAEGTVEELKTDRQFNFTKFTRIDEEYFQNCRYESVEYEDNAWEDGKPNLVVISGMSSEDLDIMRNEIFAEYGFIFKSPKWKEYFSTRPWYNPRYDNVDEFLTEKDKANIKFIIEYQRLHKDQEAQRDSIRYMWAG